MGWTKRNLERAYACNPVLLLYLRERRGWTQSQAADKSGYSSRLICKAEAGQTISVEAIEVLAETYSTTEVPIYPEDLISDPLELAKQYIATTHVAQADAIPAIAHFLDEEAVFILAGDPEIIPFAGAHQGFDAIDQAIKIFFSILEVPSDRDNNQDYSYVANGNQVVAWGESWIHPIGMPLTQPVHVQIRMKFRRGKIHELDNQYDTLLASQLLDEANKNVIL